MKYLKLLYEDRYKIKFIPENPLDSKLIEVMLENNLLLLENSEAFAIIAEPLDYNIAAIQSQAFTKFNYNKFLTNERNFNYVI